MTTLDKMEEALFALLSADEKKTVANVLARGFDGRPVSAQQSYGTNPELVKAKVKEWLVG